MMVRTIFMAMLLWSAAAGAQVVALPGTVVETGETNVSIEVCSYDAPRVDDLLEIGYKNPQENQLAIGVWRVLEVNTCFIRVSPVCNGIVPTIGQRTTVFLNSSTRGPSVIVPHVSDVESTGPDASAEMNTNIALLRSEDTRERQYAAKVLYRHYRYDPVVQASAEVALLNGYLTSPSDAYHIDAMSWLCNILGVSANPEFAASLQEVLENTTSYKLSRNADKNLRRLNSVKSR